MPINEICLSSSRAKAGVTTLTPVTVRDFKAVKKRLSAPQANWLKVHGFEATAGQLGLIADEKGDLIEILLGLGESASTDGDPWWISPFIGRLPEGKFRLSEGMSNETLATAAFGWSMCHYRFDRYKSDSEAKKRQLVGVPKTVLESALSRARAVARVRDLVNTPAEDMGPAHLQDICEEIAETHGATISTVVGDDLLDENLPAIHAVGRAAASGREPRLIDLCWGDEDAPKLTLVGKGVCFDTGGLDLKPGGAMRLMKKDMGGAAHAIALAELIMTAGLKVNLRLLVSAVENAVAGGSYRPGDIVQTRKGLTVEIGNTDAEGRVVLCDALALACEEEPNLLMDFATLTGAARVALGAELPATFTNDDDVWAELEQAASVTEDPLWRLPLWAPYDKELSSPIADLSNIAEGGFAGSITAALYLQRFIEADTPWVHFDVFAWNKKGRAGRPVGGEAQGLRAAYLAIRKILDI